MLLLLVVWVLLLVSGGSDESEAGVRIQEGVPNAGPESTGQRETSGRLLLDDWQGDQVWLQERGRSRVVVVLQLLLLQQRVLTLLPVGDVAAAAAAASAAAAAAPAAAATDLGSAARLLDLWLPRTSFVLNGCSRVRERGRASACVLSELE